MYYSTQYNIPEDLYYPVEIHFLPWKTLYFHQTGNAAYYENHTKHTDTHWQNSRVPRFLRTSWLLTQLSLLHTLKPLSIIPICVTLLQVLFISYGPKNRPYKQFIIKSYVLFLEVLFSFMNFSDSWSWPTILPELLFLRKIKESSVMMECTWTIMCLFGQLLLTKEISSHVGQV